MKPMIAAQIASILAVLLLSGASTAQAAQLNYGKYFGTIQMDGQPDAIAVSVDAFVTQIKDPTVYPALEVIVRANLGGFSSSEYIGYDYYDPTFNFEQSILQLSDSKNDLVATLTVTNTDSETILEGPVLHRLTNSKGKMRVVMELDDSLAPSMPTNPLVPTLKGEYEGKCGNDPADLQIETGRGLGAAMPGNALTGYSITGRIGFSNGPLCAPDKTNRYCGTYVFSTGTYSPFRDRLTMQGKLGTIDCSKAADLLTCSVVGFERSAKCTLAKKAESPTAPAQNPAAIFLDVPDSLKAPLPDPIPPGNDDLVNALGGDFYGFLHFENRDVYLRMEMSVVAATSTENPHIQNQVTVAPTMLLRLGPTDDATPALSLVFPQRVFWLNQGFAFKADGADFFAVIDQWKLGYLSGVLYSHSYGRVGTFELRKGDRPANPRGMALVTDPTGTFRGPIDAPDPFKNLWAISIEIPNQTPGPDQTGVPLLGRYNGPGQMTMFDASSFDLNSGSFAFLLKKDNGDRLVTGEMIQGGKMRLVWPVGPALGAPMGGYGAYIYEPKANR
jgi:hypothetical protein